jgi:hypothetical protein
LNVRSGIFVPPEIGRVKMKKPDRLPLGSGLAEEAAMRLAAGLPFTKQMACQEV